MSQTDSELSVRRLVGLLPPLATQDDAWRPSIPFLRDLLYEPLLTDGCALACASCAARPSPDFTRRFHSAP